MNMFARFDENQAMTFQDIKETKRYGRTDGQTHARTHKRTHGQRENSIPTTNKVCGGYNKTKLVDLLRWYPYQITFTPAAYYPRLQNLVPNKSWDTGMGSYDYMCSKYLIFIFTNIKEHIKRISQK